MKIFIWLASFFVIVGIPSALIVEFFDIKFGAIPTMILAGAAYWTAKALCKKWNNHKRNKKEMLTDTETEPHTSDTQTSDNTTPRFYSSDKDISEEPTAAPITPATENIAVPSAASNTKKQKPQYIKIQFKKTTALIATLCILLCSSIGINIYQAYYNKTTKESLITAENKYNRTSESADRARITLNEKNEEIENLHDIISFYERYIVILPNDNSGTYHIYGCKHCDTTRFWIYTIDNAKDAGYHPCDDCCTLIEDLYRFNLR